MGVDIIEKSLPKMRQNGWDKIQAKGRADSPEQSLLSHSVATASIALEVVSACSELTPDFDVKKEKAFVGGLIHDLHKDLGDGKGEGYSKIDNDYIERWMKKLDLGSYIDDSTSIDFWTNLVKTAHPYSGRRNALGNIDSRENLNLLFTVQLADTIASIPRIDDVLKESSKYQSVKKVVSKIDSGLSLMVHKTRELRPALTAAIHQASREVLKEDHDLYSIASYSNGDLYIGFEEKIDNLKSSPLKNDISQKTSEIIRAEIFDEDNIENHPISRGRAGLDINRALLLQPLEESLSNAIEFSYEKGPGSGHEKQAKKYIGRVMQRILTQKASEENISEYTLKGKRGKSKKKFQIHSGNQGRIELIPEIISNKDKILLKDDIFEVGYDDKGHLVIEIDITPRKEVGILAELIQIITKKIKTSMDLDPVESFKEITNVLGVDVDYEKYPRNSISAGGTYYFQFPIASILYNKFLEKTSSEEVESEFKEVKKLGNYTLRKLEKVIHKLDDTEEKETFNLLGEIDTYVNNILEIKKFSDEGNIPEWDDEDIKAYQKGKMEETCFLCGNNADPHLQFSAVDFEHTKSFSFRGLGGKELDSNWYLCNECYLDQLLLDRKLSGGDQKESLAIALYPEYHITGTRLELIKSQLEGIKTAEVVEWGGELITSGLQHTSEPLRISAVGEEEQEKMNIDKIVDSRNYILLRLGGMNVNDRYMENLTWLRAIFVGSICSHLLSMKANVTPRIIPSVNESIEIEGRLKINNPPSRVNEIFPETVSSSDLEDIMKFIGALFYSGRYLEKDPGYSTVLKGVNRVLELMCDQYFPGSTLQRIADRNNAGDEKIDDVVSLLDNWKSELIFKRINKEIEKEEVKPMNRIKKVADKLYDYYQPNLGASTHKYQQPIRKIVDVIIENSRLSKEEIISIAEGELLRTAERNMKMKNNDVYINLPEENGSLEESVTGFVTSFYENIYEDMLNEDRMRLVKQRNSIADAIFARMKQRNREDYEDRKKKEDIESKEGENLE